MNDRVQKALQESFKRHRIVFWYDVKKELRHDFEAVELQDVEKIEIANNEFGIKYYKQLVKSLQELQSFL